MTGPDAGKFFSAAKRPEPEAEKGMELADVKAALDGFIGDSKPREEIEGALRVVGKDGNPAAWAPTLVEEAEERMSTSNGDSWANAVATACLRICRKLKSKTWAEAIARMIAALPAEQRKAALSVAYGVLAGIPLGKAMEKERAQAAASTKPAAASPAPAPTAAPVAAAEAATPTTAEAPAEAEGGGGSKGKGGGKDDSDEIGLAEP